ncbi:SIMPL domain-containing protein [Massilia sp. Dwa41.01b]|uniref:SIMPL domain-containing protein n=1 Tax=Massilia sp. Dwa41.01b TaxID=2709302 RepID=UPI001601DBF4|nr:SIMPL domain-containing protein [Massilia sp. Dwa41.01b]QNA89409.1 SIMPL domain-containing protein [Massilia sp. Dwa41.01b]
MLKQFALVASLALFPVAASASPLPSYPFVHVSAEASRYTTPNIGAIDFMISASDADPAQARDTVETRIAEVRALLQEQGVPLADLETRDVRREPGMDAAGKDTARELRVSVHLIVRDLSKWRAVVAPLLVKPNLNGFATSFDITERDAFEAALMADALQDARRRAEIIARGARRKLGAVTGVSPGGVKNVGTTMGLVRPDFSYNRSKPSNVGARDFLNVDALKLIQPVDVVYKLE